MGDGEPGDPNGPSAPSDALAAAGRSPRGRLPARVLAGAAGALVVLVLAAVLVQRAVHHPGDGPDRPPVDPKALEFRPVLTSTVLAPGTRCGASSDGTTTTASSDPGTGGSRPANLRGPRPQFAPTTTRPPPPSTSPAPSTTVAPGSAPSSSVLSTTVPSTTGSQTVELASRDGKVCYLLGPIGMDGSDLAEAKAILDASGEWAVSILVRPSRRTAANALLDDCFKGTPTCPPPGSPRGDSGAVAVVRRGVVISAPTVNAAGLADQSLQITGSFSRSDAAELAHELGG